MEQIYVKAVGLYIVEQFDYLELVIDEGLIQSFVIL